MIGQSTEQIERELLRIMEMVRKVSTDTKGAVFVALQACWFDLEKVVQQDVIHLTGVIRDLRQELTKHDDQAGD